ncbi:MAG: glycosyltransferase [Proteobacteria bacterium]|nr:glycosyltransferase [Pseudomonadota bacterium]
MNILLATRYGGGRVPGDLCGKALKALGHRVLTVGPSTDPVDKQDYDNPIAEFNNICVYDTRQIIAETGFQPELLFQVEPGAFFINFQSLNIPIASWWIDTLLMPGHWLLLEENLGRNYLDIIKEHCFTSKIPHIQQYKKLNIIATHLPLALDDTAYKLFDMPKKYDIVFIGNMTYEERQYYMQLLKENGSFIVWDRGGLIADDYCRKISESYIAFNHGHVGELNMRFFELMGIGAFQLCNICHGQEELGYIDGEHLVNYTTNVELINLVNHYLIDGQAREEIARKGREYTIANHTYKHRMKFMLDAIFKF